MSSGDEPGSSKVLAPSPFPPLGAMTIGAKVLTIGILALIVGVLWLARDALAPYVIGILVIYMLLPVVHWLERLLPNRGWIGRARRPIAAIVSSIMALGFLIVLLGTLLSPIVDETQELLLNFSSYWDQIKANNPDFLEAYNEWVPARLQDWLELHIREIGASLVQGIASVAGWLLHETGSAISAVLALVSVPLFIVYYLIDERSTARTLRAQFPLAWSADALSAFRIFDRVFGAYTRGVILEATIVGIITGFGYWLIGVEVFLPLGVVAFVGEIVPIVGPWIAFIISFPVILATQPELAIPAMLLFLVIQMLEGWFLAPQIQGSSNDFTNSGTLVLLAIGGAIGGGLGMILALPVAGLTRALSVYVLLRLQGEGPEEALVNLPLFRRSLQEEAIVPEENS